jgi:hypothetical protein
MTSSPEARTGLAGLRGPIATSDISPAADAYEGFSIIIP